MRTHPVTRKRHGKKALGRDQAFGRPPGDERPRHERVARLAHLLFPAFDPTLDEKWEDEVEEE